MNFWIIFCNIFLHFRRFKSYLLHFIYMCQVSWVSPRVYPKGYSAKIVNQKVTANINRNVNTLTGVYPIRGTTKKLNPDFFYCHFKQIFDMKKFQANVNRELSRSYPDRRRLETQCLSIISFVKTENEILECPIWIMIVNVVAMDMLKSKLPPGKFCG